MVSDVETRSAQAVTPRPFVIAVRLPESGVEVARGAGTSPDDQLSRAQSHASSLIQAIGPMPGKRPPHEYGPAVVEITDQDAATLRRNAGESVIITPLIRYSIARPPTYPVYARVSVGPRDAAPPTRPIQINVIGSTGRPIAGARVRCFFSRRLGWGVEGVTNQTGTATLAIPGPGAPESFEIIIVEPSHSFWPIYRIGVPVRDQELTLEALPAPTTYQWWEQLLGAELAHEQGIRGSGVKVAVIDTGIGPHSDLQGVAGGMNFTSDGEPAAYGDVDGHGTHVAGIIGASGVFNGIAPDVQIFAARVFPQDGEADSDDVAAAIETAVNDWQCDIINLSLGGAYDPLIENRINYATARGTLCVAAAGNSGGPVEYPAALRNSVCIAALGRLGSYPSGTLHELSEPSSRGLYVTDDLYAADFTCRGPQVDGCAPGVAVVSTVGTRYYAALDGTSMASPMAVGIAALILSANEPLLRQSRDGTRSATLRAELQVHPPGSRGARSGYGTLAAGGLRRLSDATPCGADDDATVCALRAPRPRPARQVG